MFPRILSPRKDYSFFLFGARGVGKTTLLQHLLPPANTHIFDLLDLDLEHRLLRRPGEFSELLEKLPPSVVWVVVDEIQKVPGLLNEVHRQIEKNKKRYFVLTGSSARKLKRGQANLLAGRAFTYALYPLCIQELGERFSLEQALQFGTLPKIFSFEDTEGEKSFLRSYAQTYLKEEIQMEGLIRDLPSFHRFLPLAAQANGDLLTWSNFASDVGVDAKTIRSFFEILEDTLLGFFLPAFRRSLRKRQRTQPKFYFFDPGVKRALAEDLNSSLTPGTSEYGRAFEHFFVLEIFRMNAYLQKDFRFSYFGTHDVEIDLVIERPGKKNLTFVEFKSSEYVRDSEIKTLKTLLKEIKGSEAICVSREPRKRLVDKVLILPWQEAVSEIFSQPLKMKS